MGDFSSKLTVYFEDPFWIGIFERVENGELSVAKVTFGDEPKDYEINAFVLKYYGSLQYSPAVENHIKEIKRNPKRMQREVKRQLKAVGIGTKSQQALKLQLEQRKLEHKVKSKERRMLEERRLRELKMQKKKEKHKGH